MFWKLQYTCVVELWVGLMELAYSTLGTHAAGLLVIQL